MKTPLTIAFPKSRPSPWLEAEIRSRVERLELICPDLLACRVVVDIPHRHHQRGNTSGATVSRCGSSGS